MRRICYCFVAFSWLAQAQLTMNVVPSRVFSQHALTFPITSTAPNLLEGRELNRPSAIAFDAGATPPILYVADTANNRVLAWRDPDNLPGCGTEASLTCGLATFVIGQADFYSSFPQTPDSTITHGYGLNQPTGLAVDSNGNLYVADAGNNRILRFPAPAKQTGAIQADLVIGQATVTSGVQSNMGQTQPSAQTLSLCCIAGRGLAVGLAFDPAGNLWVADPGNNRVVRFPGPKLATNQLAPNTPLPAADAVLGQLDLTTGTLNSNASPTSPLILAVPLGLAIDANGALYALDSFSRVLYFAPGSTGAIQSGQSAARILGLPPTTSQGSSSQYVVGVPNGEAAQGIFVSGSSLYVADSSANRVVYFDSPANWAPATAALPSPPFIGVIGQADADSKKANQGHFEPDATTLHRPTAGAALNGAIWIADSLNHRVLGFKPAGTATFSAATRLVGQLGFAFNSPNLIEGREISLNGNGSSGIAIDASSTPPHLYVVDSQNNRVLGFKDARNVAPGTRADIVIGQPDMFRSLINYPSGDSDIPTQSGLFVPAAAAVDKQGNLLIADSGNGRVLRFPSPFQQPAGALQKADLVLGQADFLSTNTDPTSKSMAGPAGVALFADGSIAVSDRPYNRVLIFRRPSNADFSNGQSASAVLGQTGFASIVPGGTNGMANPVHLAVDSDNRLYVCDTGNRRVLIFAQGVTVANGAFASLEIPGFVFPLSVAVSPTTGEFWVADANAQQLLHYPAYNTILLSGGKQPSDQTLSAATPVAVAFDSFGNVIVEELINRISFYFPVLAFRHTASFNNLPVAPGSLIYVARPGVDFTFTSASAGAAPWPFSLGNVQVTMNGTTRCPIFLVTGNAVYFQVPSSAPTSGFAGFMVSDSVTGQIFADAQIPMAVANPGFYTANAQGFGPAAALNLPEFSQNSASNPILKDGKHYLQFYLTGLGAIPGGPPDGEAPASPISAPQSTVFIAQGCVGGFCPDSSIQFSGLADYPGVWVINFLVPSTSNSGCGNVIAVAYNNILSNRGPSGTLQVSYCAK